MEYDCHGILDIYHGICTIYHGKIMFYKTNMTILANQFHTKISKRNGLPLVTIKCTLADR